MSTKLMEGVSRVRWEDVGFSGVTDQLSIPTGARTPQPESDLYVHCVACELTFVGEPGGIFRHADALAISGGTGSTVVVIGGETFDSTVAIERWARPVAGVIPAAMAGGVDLSVAARIEYVRRHLSLSMTHLAVIMGVTRTTLYAWQDGPSSPRPRSLRRLGALAEVARRWAGRSPEPVGAWLMTPLNGGATLLDLLSTARWDRVAIDAAVDALATALEWTRGRRPAVPSSTEASSPQRSLEDQRRAQRVESRRLFRQR